MPNLDLNAKHGLIQIRDQLIEERNHLDEAISSLNGWIASNSLDAQILMLKSSGFSYNSISEKLGISNVTVYNHLRKLRAEGKIIDSKSEEVDFGDC